MRQRRAALPWMNRLEAGARKSFGNFSKTLGSGAAVQELNPYPEKHEGDASRHSSGRAHPPRRGLAGPDTPDPRPCASVGTRQPTTTRRERPAQGANATTPTEPQHPATGAADRHAQGTAPRQTDAATYDRTDHPPGGSPAPAHAARGGPVQ